MADYISVCRTDELAPGTARVCELRGKAVGVFRLENGELLAVADTCTHEEASLSEGEIEDDTVYCPLHGAQFNLRTGKAMTLPAVFPIRTYDVRVVDGDIQIAEK